MLSNISSLIDVGWYLGTCYIVRVVQYNNQPRVGIPFNDTNWRLQIAEYSEAILGDRLLSLQAANEPDLYAE